MHPYVEAHPEEEGQRASQEGEPRPQAQHGPQLLTERPHQLTLLALGDPPGAWRAAGFEVDEAGRFRLGSTEVLCLDLGIGGFVGWAIDGVQHPLDGLATADGHSSNDDRPDGTGHPNGISSIDHVVVSTDDCDRTIAAFETAGLELRGGRRTGSYGSPMRQSFFWAGDVIIEVVGPDRGDPTTAPPSEPAAEQIAGRSASVFGLALVAEDLDATAGFLGDRLGTPKDAVQARRRIAGLRHRDAGLGLPIAVMSPHPH